MPGKDYGQVTGTRNVSLGRLRRAVRIATDLPQIRFALKSFSPGVRIMMLSYHHCPPVGAVEFGPDIQV